MDLNFTPEEERFRGEVRDFMRSAMPPDIRETIEAGERVNRDHMVRWQKILHAKGWGAAGWPKSGAARAGIRSARTSSRRKPRSRVRRASCRSACAWSRRC